ncbi:outer membrane receptor for ferrienterochelin and colicins [Mesorhizobium sp. J18]|nr:outer membrane receptor for ferrienterochelin and colicins [Mesorhizobium sp. J18]
MICVSTSRTRGISRCRDRRNWILGTSLAFLIPSPMWAQEQAPVVTQLQEVVVTAAGFEQNVADAPASITVITREDLEKGSFRDLTDALKEAQGVTVTGPANEKDIHIRGLSGAYTLILVDGKRQNTRESRPNGSAGYEQSFIPPITAIERIEIVRGPMSSLYGSEAMGGVINIITRKVSDVWSGSVTVEGTAQQHSRYGNSGQSSFYVSGPVVDDLVGIQVWGRGFLREEDSYVGGVEEAKEGNIGGRLTFTPNEDHDIYLEGSLTRMRRLSHVGETVEAGGRDPLDSYRDFDHGRWALTHVGRWGPTTSEFSIQQEFGRRASYSSAAGADDWDKTDRIPRVRNTVLDGKFTTPFDAFGQHVLITGGQYNNGRLTDHDDDPVDQTYSIDQWALFAEDEWSITDTFALTGGIRLDHHEIYGSHTSPRLYGVWHATDSLTVKGGVSTGFLAPEIRSIAPGYYYPTQRGAGVIVPNPDLVPEESVSYEIGAVWDSYQGLTLGATFFYTDFKNKLGNANSDLIIDTSTGAIRDPGQECTADIISGTEKCLWERYNIEGATIKGVELTATWDATPTLSFRGSYTYTDSEQTSGEFKGLPLTRTPEHQASLRADWQAMENLDVWALVTYHGSQINASTRGGVSEYPDYTIFDVGAAYAFSDNVTLKGAVYNVFDKRVDPDDFGTETEGRRFWVGLTTTF